MTYVQMNSSQIKRRFSFDKTKVWKKYLSYIRNSYRELIGSRLFKKIHVICTYVAIVHMGWHISDIGWGR